MVVRNSDGFLQKYKHPYISEIQFYMDGNTCKILFRDGLEVVKPFQFEAVYLSQFGAPLSEDGRTLLISDWEKGLMAYDIEVGSLRWQFKSPRIAKTLVYKSFVIAVKRYDSLIMFDIETGDILKRLKSSSIEAMFSLTEKMVLVNSLRGKVSVVDISTLEIVKTFSPKEINPNDCLSLIINDVYLQDGNIILCGFEGCAHRNPSDSHVVKYQRSLPATFL